jgi:four helix bundle protein
MNSYRSLRAWQSAHRMCLLVLRAADRPYRPATAPLLSQLRRAAISVETNIVEGYALASTAQFRRHLRIARGSAAEVECLVGLAAELGYLDAGTLARLSPTITETLRTLYGLIRSKRLRPDPGLDR